MLDELDMLADRLGGKSANYATPGDLARALEPRTIQTPALNILDNALVDTLDAHPRLIFTMPPQEGKSQRVSRWYTLWLLLGNPDLRGGVVSYSDALARRWGRTVRNDIRDHQRLDLAVRGDTAAANEWQLDGHDGGLITAGIGSSLTGRPLDFVIVDDPFKGRKEAQSEVQRETVKDFWRSTLSTRMSEGAPVVVIQTRWHQDDLAGYLLAEDPGEWHHINIPALADHSPEKGETDVLGREPGEWMLSARGRTAKGWLRRQKDAGAYDFAALYQGRPSPGEGGVIKRDWWRHYTSERAVRKPDGTWYAPGASEVIQSWDLTFKDTKGSDWVVGQVWARQGPKAWLLDEVRARAGFPETCRLIRQTTAKWPQASRKLIEDKANGPAVISQLRMEIGGIVPVTPVDSKEARVHAVTPFIQAGDVELPDPSIAPWIGEFVEECSAFPNGAHDDRVDTMSQALHQFFLGPKPGIRVLN